MTEPYIKILRKQAGLTQAEAAHLVLRARTTAITTTTGTIATTTATAMATTAGGTVVSILPDATGAVCRNMACLRAGSH